MGNEKTSSSKKSKRRSVTPPPEKDSLAVDVEKELVIIMAGFRRFSELDREAIAMALRSEIRQKLEAKHDGNHYKSYAEESRFKLKNLEAELNGLKFPVDLRIVFDQVEQRYNFSMLIVCFRCGEVGHISPNCQMQNPLCTPFSSNNKLEIIKYNRAQKWYWLFKTKPGNEIRMLVEDLENLLTELKSKKSENLSPSEIKLVRLVYTMDDLLRECSKAVAEAYEFVNCKVHISQDVIKRLKALNIFGIPGDLVFIYFIEDLGKTTDSTLPPVVLDA